MILLDYKDRRPIYEQVVERFQELMIRGILEPDSPMPSVRNLAMDLSINPNTIQRAYAELERQGFIYTIKGKGSFAADTSIVRNAGQEDLKQELKTLVEKAIMLGIDELTVTSMVSEYYSKRGRDDD